MRPSAMNTMRSATSRAKRSSWVTTIMVMPASARRRITESTSDTSSGSSAEVGSSKSMTRGEPRRQVIGVMGEPHARQQRGGPRAGELRPLPVYPHRRLADVLERGQVLEEVELLEHH